MMIRARPTGHGRGPMAGQPASRSTFAARPLGKLSDGMRTVLGTDPRPERDALQSVTRGL